MKLLIGYVIQDENQNQYVWVPVENDALFRNTTENEHYIDKEDTINEFIESVNQYGGFYIARYEASIFEGENSDKSIAATIQNKIPWTNIKYSTAQEVSSKSASEFGYKDCKTSIINSYAWDTTLAWLNLTMANYSTNLSYGNYSGQIFYTGATVTDMINNVCDMAGNVKEWTSEIYTEKSLSTENRVVRGGNANLNKPANSRSIYEASKIEDNLGFRMILYKIPQT